MSYQMAINELLMSSEIALFENIPWGYLIVTCFSNESFIMNCPQRNFLRNNTTFHQLFSIKEPKIKIDNIQRLSKLAF